VIFDNIPNLAEVQLAEQSLNSYPAWMIDHLAGGPAPDARHLPTAMQNVTVDQTLNEVARRFRGTVMYGTCRWQGGKQLFRLNFIYAKSHH
jgi:hypothetical protein